ncbi:MAG TPA: DUF2214 family protein [Candidatus Acidoferrales bacterium]|nr:DUF2214 family protein [Candidatus Acidoferrales bacterium]
MIRDVLLAWLHFLCIFMLVSALVAEFVLYRRKMDLGRLRQLQRIDSFYGASAGLVILSGVARVVWGLKGPAFYLHNPIFWTKMGLFATVAVLSLPPTLHFLRLRGRADAAGAIVVDDRGYTAMWVLLGLEAALVACIPFFATLLAHGFN